MLMQSERASERAGDGGSGQANGRPSAAGSGCHLDALSGTTGGQRRISERVMIRALGKAGRRYFGTGSCCEHAGVWVFR